MLKCIKIPINRQPEFRSINLSTPFWIILFHTHAYIVQCWVPQIAKLVYNSNNYCMPYDTYNYNYLIWFMNNFILGGQIVVLNPLQVLMIQIWR